MKYNKRKIILFSGLSLLFGTLSVVFYLLSDRSPAIEEEISFIVTSDSIENSVENTLSQPVDTLPNAKEIQEDTFVENTLEDSLMEVNLTPKDEFIHLDQVKGKHLIIIGTFKQKDNALTLKDQTIEKGHEQCLIIHDGGTFYWVVFNIYNDLISAKKDNDKFKLEGWIKKM